MPENEVARPEMRKPSPIGPEVYWSIVTALFLVGALLIGLLPKPYSDWVKQDSGFSAFTLYTVIFAALVLISYRKQNPDFWMIKLIGGRAIQVSEQGPTHVLRLPLFETITLPKSSIQEEYPKNGDQIDWEKESGQPPAEGKVAPIRVTTDPRPAAPGNPLEHTMTLAMSLAVSYRIYDPLQFVVVLGGGVNGEEGLKNARKQIEDVSIATLTAVVGKNTPARIISNFSVINLALEKAIQYLVDGVMPEVNANGEVIGGRSHPSSAWGVEIISVQVVRNDMPLEVNKQMRDVPAAHLEKVAVEARAEGEKRRLTLVGQGTASARQALEEAALVGFANGFRSALKLAEDESIGLTPQQLAAVQTADKIAQSDNKTIVLGEQVITSLPRQIAEALNRT